METSKKKINITVIVILMFFIIFIAIYFTSLTDLYEYQQYNKTSITKEAIEKFEKDVEEGKNIVIEDYLDITAKDYSNSLSKLGNKTSNFFENVMTRGIKRTFQVIVRFFS